MPVAEAVVRVQACGFDRQLDRRAPLQVKTPFVALEVTFDRREPPERGRAEFDARARRIDPPPPLGDALGVGGLGDGVQCSLGFPLVRQLPCPGVLGEDVIDLVVMGRVRDVDLDGAIDEDRAHLFAAVGFRRARRARPARLPGAAARACTACRPTSAGSRRRSRRAWGRPRARARGPPPTPSSSSAVSSLPAVTVTNATGTSPECGSGRPTAAAAVTSGCSSSPSSIVAGSMLWPPRMIRSLARPASRMNPSPSTDARSPVSSHPSLIFPSGRTSVRSRCRRGSRRRCSGRAARASRPRFREGTSSRRVASSIATARASW